MLTLKTLTPSLALTIGIFDGVHEGHQAVLKRVRECGDIAAVLTFSTHPMTLFAPEHPIQLLCSLEERARRIEQMGIDLLFLIPFTREVAGQTAEEFLKSIRKAYPFTHLVLGHDAVFGKNREGTPEKVQELGVLMGFSVEYVDAVCDTQGPISSTRLRQKRLGA